VTSIARSHEELGAARNLVNSGFPRQAISRAYYAAFYAARAALEVAGEPSPKTHSGMRSRFSDLARSKPSIGPGSGSASSSATSSSASSGSGGSTASKSPIVIGELAALSGAAVISPPTTLVPTLNAWVNMVNSTGGINGHPVKLIVEDDQGIAANALADLQKLEADHVVALVGVFDSPTEAVWRSAIDKTDIPVIGDPSDLFWDTDSHYFPITTTIIAGTMAVPNILKIYGGSVYGYAYCAELAVCKQAIPLTQAAAHFAGMSYGAAVGISSSSANDTAPCLALKAAKVNAIAVGVGDLIQFAESCASQNYHPLMSVNQADLATPGLLSSSAINNHLWALASVFPPFANAPAVTTFTQELAKYGPGITPDFNSSTAWTSGLLFEEAAKAVSGTVTASSVTAALRANKTTLGGLAPGTLDYSNPTFHPVNCYFYAGVQNHKLVAPAGLNYKCTPESVYSALHLQ
jgi:branched-chain amino acid transport system substrate-binding protein